MTPFRPYLLAFASVVCVPFASADQHRPLSVTVEGGAASFTRNDVRIPNDGGTRYDMLNLTGEGPDPYARLYVHYAFNDRHSLRLNLAPLQSSGTGEFAESVDFVDSTFAADTPTRGSYRFNTYRLTYRWLFHQSERWDWGVGGALLVRDAKVELTQGDLNALDDDVGVVPLLHLYGAYDLGDGWSLVLDVEGAGAPQGRAIDAALQAHYQLDRHWSLAGGYRILDGGADNDSLYTFARVHYAHLAVGYRF
ncbi:hypothetical protein [Marinimicrobium alkaliphilum]|uniref:hypothetical protein n=1 Tax=Marinimicrobium alkaliphilum TaxID=2202654 RepID=UPI000DB97A9E|nr:hypothetical protein [Marinimicrobium alkaliphilum]